MVYKKKGIKITCVSGICTFQVANNEQQLLYVLARGEEKCKMRGALSGFLMQPFCAVALTPPWWPSLDLLPYVNVGLMLGSPSQDLLQGSSWSLTSAKLGWESLLVGKSPVVQK